MPFDAMKGLHEALRDREEHYCRVDRHDISEELRQKNSAVLVRLNKGDVVLLDCWHRFHDVQLKGSVTELNIPFGYLKLNGEKILFEDIYSIKIIDLDC